MSQQFRSVHNMGNGVLQIIPYYAHPHVHTVIFDHTWYDETVATPRDPDDMPFHVATVIGADTGIDNTFVRITNHRTKRAIFGLGDFHKYGQPSLQADRLFNGDTGVWMMRVLPDDATYANHVVVAYYRVADVVEEASDVDPPSGSSNNPVTPQERRLEILFRVERATRENLPGDETDDNSNPGATTDERLREFGEDFYSSTARPPSAPGAPADPLTGYRALPLYYVRSIGRGQYGDRYALRITRDVEAEREYDMKMYRFGLLETNWRTRQTNIFSGSLYQTTRWEMSTLISDVLSQFPTGSCPVFIHVYEDYFKELYDVYRNEVVQHNLHRFLDLETGTVNEERTEEERADQWFAMNISPDQFDPIFGLRQSTRRNERIPYYKNYTVRPDGPWEWNPDKDREVPDTPGAQRPETDRDWDGVRVGSRLLMVADPLRPDENGNPQRWLYRVTALNWNEDYPAPSNPYAPGTPEYDTWVDPGPGAHEITYDEGRLADIDEDQYVGDNLSLQVGQQLIGGNDGRFQQVRDSETMELRPPHDYEMKLWLSEEYVKAWRGDKDRKILSPARTEIDFIFDANYNMSDADTITGDDNVRPFFFNNTVLTDEDNRILAAFGITRPNILMAYNDVNVKKAMYDLNEFRTRNGMTITRAEGAGTLLHLDCAMTGLSQTRVSRELIDIIDMFADFDGRNTSIDLGFYQIFDPVSGKRISVTSTYFLAQNYVPHIMRNGLNKPFVYSYATLRALRRNPVTLRVTGNMIADTFRPDIDLIDWDVKEQLFLSRINYYLTSDEGRIVQRACQNTRQRDASMLLEESNVRVLNALKKGLERACKNYLYEWNEVEARQGYTEAQMEVYRPWIGTMIDDIRIYFTANEWEQERKIMRCWVEVAFREIIKRIILEINITRAADFGEMEEGITIGETRPVNQWAFLNTIGRTN